MQHAFYAYFLKLIYREDEAPQDAPRPDDNVAEEKSVKKKQSSKVCRQRALYCIDSQLFCLIIFCVSFIGVNDKCKHQHTL